MLNINKRWEFGSGWFVLFMLSFVFNLSFWMLWQCFFFVKSVIVIYYRFLLKIVPSIFKIRWFLVAQWFYRKLMFFMSFNLRLLHDCIFLFCAFVRMFGGIGVDWVTILILLYFGRLCYFGSSEGSFLSFLPFRLAWSIWMHWVVIMLSAVSRLLGKVGSDSDSIFFPSSFSTKGSIVCFMREIFWLLRDDIVHYARRLN